MNEVFFRLNFNYAFCLKEPLIKQVLGIFAGTLRTAKMARKTTTHENSLHHIYVPGLGHLHKMKKKI